MNKLLYLSPIILLLLISGCTQPSPKPTDTGKPIDTTGYIDSSQPNQAYDQFCQKLSSCEQTNLKLKASGTGDLYSVSVLGLKDAKCQIKLAFEKSGTQKTKILEGLEATCAQNWEEDFKNIANLKGEDCRDYTNNILLNMVLDMKKQDSLCAGSLRDKILEGNK